MMLTGQVFSIMAGTATEEQIRQITKSADRYLYDEKVGGYRLNTDFGEVKTDLGRMFGFSYGDKENGAVFSHMAVMYANAALQRGFAKEGCKSLPCIVQTVGKLRSEPHLSWNSGILQWQRTRYVPLSDGRCELVYADGDHRDVRSKRSDR